MRNSKLFGINSTVYHQMIHSSISFKLPKYMVKQYDGNYERIRKSLQYIYLTDDNLRTRITLEYGSKNCYLDQYKLVLDVSPYYNGKTIDWYVTFHVLEHESACEYDYFQALEELRSVEMYPAYVFGKKMSLLKYELYNKIKTEYNRKSSTNAKSRYFLTNTPIVQVDKQEQIYDDLPF